MQAILSDANSQTGIAIIKLAQAVGPAVSVAAGQSIFTTTLGPWAGQLTPGTGRADSGDGSPGLSEGNRSAAVSALVHALDKTFYLPVVLGCCTLIGTLGVEWRSVKDRGR